ncbi:SymE family type I addiction module toxin [Kosakonia sp. AX9b]
MAEKHSKAEPVISKTRRRYKVGYVSARHFNSKTYMTTYYSQHPSLHLKGGWLAEAGFETGRGVTVKISEGCIVLMADNNEMQALREQLYQAKQVVKWIKDGMFSVLNEG